MLHTALESDGALAEIDFHLSRQPVFPSIPRYHLHEIALDARHLGFDGIIAPNARWPCLNLTLFTERCAPEQFGTITSKPVDLREWGRARGQRP